jgi:hypothetical protein
MLLRACSTVDAASAAVNAAAQLLLLMLSLQLTALQSLKKGLCLRASDTPAGDAPRTDVASDVAGLEGGGCGSMHGDAMPLQLLLRRFCCHSASLAAHDRPRLIGFVSALAGTHAAVCAAVASVCQEGTITHVK